MKTLLALLLTLATASAQTLVCNARWNSNAAKDQVTSYVLKYSLVAGGNVGAVETASTNATLTTLLWGQQYRFVVTAKNRWGESAPSAAVVVTMPEKPEPPQPPTGLQIIVEVKAVDAQGNEVPISGITIKPKVETPRALTDFTDKEIEREWLRRGTGRAMSAIGLDYMETQWPPRITEMILN